MTLKAVLFDFNGVIINDEPIHEKLINQILIEENLRPKPGEFRQICLGRSDRACISEILSNRGRVVTESYLMQLMTRKAQAYLREMENLEKLPIFPAVEDLIYKLRIAKVKIGLVTGALRSEVELVLNRVNFGQYFTIVVTGDDITASKPDPEGYLLAVQRFNEQFRDLNLQPSECLAIEDTPAGIQAAKSAGMQVVGVANSYPFHMLQRQANWSVDYLTDVDVERVQQVFSQKSPQATVSG